MTAVKWVEDAHIAISEILNNKKYTEKYIQNENELISFLKISKKQIKKIAFTNGCFDIIHPGHIHVLSQAKLLGDILVVGLNSDKSVKNLKKLFRVKK